MPEWSSRQRITPSTGAQLDRKHFNESTFEIHEDSTLRFRFSSVQRPTKGVKGRHARQSAWPELFNRKVFPLHVITRCTPEDSRPWDCDAGLDLALTIANANRGAGMVTAPPIDSLFGDDKRCRSCSERRDELGWKHHSNSLGDRAGGQERRHRGKRK